MPVYDYECVSCGNIEEKVHSIAVLGIQQYCSICNGRMAKLLSAPMVHVSKVEYRCPITNAPTLLSPTTSPNPITSLACLMGTTIKAPPRVILSPTQSLTSSHPQRR